MLNIMEWKEVYDLWQTGCCYLPAALSAPVTAEFVKVRDDREGCIFYGYDWLYNGEVPRRKRLISKKPIEFMCFTKPSNKGTITTIQMLAEAKDAEERAAVWIAATAFDLMQDRSGGSVASFAWSLNSAACAFLRGRYCSLWHHAMRKLVPDIMIPHAVLSDMNCSGPDSVMGLIQTNVLLIRGNYTPLLYSSIDEDDPEFKTFTARQSLR